MMKTAEKYMERCISLALKGFGHVAPNPMVGCVIVHNDKVIGEGYHEHYGHAHAEVNAINSVENKALLQSSTLYVTLEPCTHFGKTPPCADLIISHQVPKVVIGTIDPNPAVQGKGIKKLEDAGCLVQVGISEDACKELNKRFFTFHTFKRPYVILKWAQTADGFIDRERKTAEEGIPLAISNSEARRLSHQWRAEEQAILVGTNTAVLDNPQLTVRDVAGINPLRIVIDKNLRTPVYYYLLDGTTPTLVFTAVKRTNTPNLEYIVIDFEADVISQVMQHLFKRNIQSLIVEGGAELLQSVINKNLWDEARIVTSSSMKIAKGVKAPVLHGETSSELVIGDNLLKVVVNLKK